MILYNHYIPDDTIFTPIEEESSNTYESKKWNPFSFFSENKEKDSKSGVKELIENFHIGNFDASDILLLLILLFLFLESDNWEIAIILGVVLFLSFKSDDAV